MPWEQALYTSLDLIAGEPIDWWLGGSAALAVRGAPDRWIPEGILYSALAAADASSLGRAITSLPQAGQALTRSPAQATWPAPPPMRLPTPQAAAMCARL